MENQKRETNVNRRGVLCGAALIAMGFLPDAAEAATGITQSKAGKIVVDLNLNKSLAKVGGVVTIPLQDGSSIALLRKAAGTKGLIALNLSCTHQGVPVVMSGNSWVCPAHGSKFALTGAVTNGPAQAPLQKYPLTATATKVTIG
jgi:Rieske Fe-S protein